MPKFRKKKKQEKIETSNLTEVEQAILNTLCYRSVFSYPMSYHQIGTFLLSGKEFGADSVSEGLESLVKQDIITSKDDKYYLKGEQPVGWKYRKKSSMQLLKESEPFIKAVGKIPWIKMIAVTGSVAACNAGKTDDVDIFIVTGKNRVWLARFFTVLLLKILGKYRTDKESERKLCPNLFVDITNIRWTEEKQNSYVAHEIAMMVPVVDKENTYFMFMKENSWINNFLANYKVAEFEVKSPVRRQSRTVDLFEDVLMRVQILYMLKRKTSELVDRNIIHFNRDDSSNSVISQFEEAKNRFLT